MFSIITTSVSIIIHDFYTIQYILREDYELAEMFDTDEKKNDFYTKIKSGAETGWDFSSRWFIDTSDSSSRGKWL